MCSIIEPNHSKLNLIGAPVVTAAYTAASPLLATDEGGSLAANEPGAARAAALSVARAARTAAITAVPRASAMAFGLELQNAFDYPNVHRGGLAARRVLYLHSAEGVVSVFRQYEAAALARFARVLYVASYRHGPVRADYEVFSRAGPADTRPRARAGCPQKLPKSTGNKGRPSPMRRVVGSWREGGCGKCLAESRPGSGLRQRPRRGLVKRLPCRPAGPLRPRP